MGDPNPVYIVGVKVNIYILAYTRTCTLGTGFAVNMLRPLGTLLRNDAASGIYQTGAGAWERLSQQPIKINCSSD
jgi:hypothetical protein